MDDSRHILVSCLFGGLFNKVYPAIPDHECIFFTNNESLRHEIESKGLEFYFAGKHALSDNYRVSSQQSKYIKIPSVYKRLSRILVCL
jgi:hypothetical protein